MTKFTTRALAAAAAAGLLLTWASPASAHVGLAASEQSAGKSTLLTFSVSHGCDGSPTTKLEIQVPESIVNVTPVRHALFDISVETEELAVPIESDHGDPITTRDSVVVFTATEPLPADQRDSVQLSLSLPAEAADTRLYFPVVQTCESGANDWIELPADGSDAEPDSPAPFLDVSAASGDSGDDHGHGGESAGDDESNTGNDAESDGDSGTDAVSIIALIVGALGLAFGAGALITVSKKK